MGEQSLSQLFNTTNSKEGAELFKSITAGSKTGMQLDGLTMSGNDNLKVESLDSTVRLLESTMQHIQLFNMLPKQNILNTVHQFAQLVKYGEAQDFFMDEGETPSFSDTNYRRQSVDVKFAGVSGQLTHQSMLVKRLDSQNPYTAEVENKTQLLLQTISKNIATANSGLVSQEFDGLYQQHYDGVGALYPVTSLDNYYNDTCVIDARGQVLKDSFVQDACHAVVNDRFGMVSKIIAPPVVFKDYVERYQDQKRFLVGQAGAISGATTGQQVTKIQTQFEPIDIVNDIFMERKESKRFNSPATGAKSPQTPTSGGTSVAVKTDTNTKFTDGAGSYFYGVTSKNRHGESAMLLLTSTAQAVAATQSVELDFSISDNSYPATAYVIYRTEKDDLKEGKFYPIIELSVGELAAGYDGAGVNKVWDRNRVLPNTHSAMVLEPSSNLWEYLQLAGTMKVDFAITTLAKRFSVINYGTPALYMPGKVARIVNIGKKIV